MQRTHALRRLLAVTLTAAFTMVAVVPPAGAATKATHCIVEVVSVDARGLGTLGPVTCAPTDAGARLSAVASGGMSLLSYTIATHYSGLNYTGSTLTVTGDGCSGLYINMPAGWVDVVSSTRSSCIVTHYDYFYLFGSTMTLFNPGGNLTGFDNMTNSAQYL